jgi:AcrR family transcriptional regulator
MVTVRQRNVATSRREIVQSASALFLAEGYDEVTLERVSRETGASVRTLMRYFGSKDRLALAEHIVLLERFEARFGDGPAAEAVLKIWSEHIHEVAVRLQEDTEWALAHFRMVFNDLTLRSRFLSIQQRYEDVLAESMAREAGAPEPALTHRVLAASVVAGNLALIRTWLDGGAASDLRAQHRAVMAYATSGLSALEE